MHFVHFLCKPLIEVFFKKSHKFYTFCTLPSKKPVKSRVSQDRVFSYQVQKEISKVQKDNQSIEKQIKGVAHEESS